MSIFCGYDEFERCVGGRDSEDSVALYGTEASEGKACDVAYIPREFRGFYVGPDYSRDLLKDSAADDVGNCGGDECVVDARRPFGLRHRINRI